MRSTFVAKVVTLAIIANMCLGVFSGTASAQSVKNSGYSSTAYISTPLVNSGMLAHDAGLANVHVSALLLSLDGSSNTSVAASALLTGTEQSYVMPRYVTAPDLLPQVIVTKTTAEPLGEGQLFLTPFWNWDPSQGQYAMIVDDQANLIYYRSYPAPVHDLKVQSNGLLTFFDYSPSNEFKVLDQTYELVDTWRAGNGYQADVHDLQVLPNNHALLMIYAYAPLDLSSYGGQANAQVIDLILQELDENKNVVFQWNSRDHFAITDTYEPLTGSVVDLVHGNAVELDTDGNLLLSSRHLSEITKIDRSTGEIIWRLGGKNNQFQFIGDSTLPNVGGFSYQHDIRRLPNGNITLFDNANQFIAAGQHGSRGVEYTLDETAKTATFVREFRLIPDITSLYMGNLQRLPNGNSLVGWGGGTLPPNVAQPREAATEFTPSGQVAMSVNFFGTPFTSYRAYRFPWQGYPATPPTLVAVTSADPTRLYYSWNGATEVVSYTVAGGAMPDTLLPIAIQPKTGFEEMTQVPAEMANDCFFRVTPFDKSGQQNRSSSIAYLGDSSCTSAATYSPTESGSHDLVLPGASEQLTVTLSLQSSAVPTTTIFALSQTQNVTQPALAGKVWISPAFALRAFTANSLGQDAIEELGALADSFTLILDYGKLNMPRSMSLNLVAWDAAQQTWSTVQLLSNDTVQRRLTVSVTHLGLFALLADNQIPVSSNAFAITDEDVSYTFQSANFPYYDGDGDPIQSVVIESPPQLGVMTFAGAPISAGQNISASEVSSLVFVAPPDANGIPFTTFGFSVSDGFATSSGYTGTVLVRPINDAPVAVADSAKVPVGLATTAVSPPPPVTIDVLANDYDVDGDHLRLGAISQPQHGTATLQGDHVLYTPGSDYKGTDRFTYTITDDRGGEATTDVNVTDSESHLYLPTLQKHMNP